MKATCRCGGEWECTTRTDMKIPQLVKCLRCGTTDKDMVAKQELSVDEDFVTWDHPDNPLRRAIGEMKQPDPMPLSGPDLTVVGHLVQAIENASHALRSALIDKGMVRDGKWDSEWTEAAKKLEHDAGNLRRRLEDFARKTGAQIYMLS